MKAISAPQCFLLIRLLRSERKSGLVLPCAMGSICGLRICQASARRPCRHFLDQKKVAKDCRCAGLFCPQAMFRESLGCAPLSFFCPTVVSVYQITPVGPEVRASLSLPRESDKERPGSPPGPRAGRQPSSGGCKGRGPSAEGPPLRGRSALTGGPVPPCAPLPSGGNQFAQRSGANCEPAGATPPPVNLWPLSFDQESGDLGVGLLPDIFSNHSITHSTN